MKPRIKENPEYYLSKEQQTLLNELVSIGLIGDNFFLTGGTALSVFYLHHRVSEDLDFFTTNDIELGDIDELLKKTYLNNIITIRTSLMFLSYLIGGIKIDFVIDPLSQNEERPHLTMIAGNDIKIDTIDNISANKLTTIVSRFEIKDVVDFFYISKEYWSHSKDMFLDCYKRARKREALLDDPAESAYQIEKTIEFVKSKKDELTPMLRKNVDWIKVEAVRSGDVNFIYRLQQWK